MTTHHIDELLAAMTLQEQASLLAGADFWTTVPVPRLGVPAIKVSDGPNGARGGVFKDGPATACFPAGVALASTWNPALIEQMGAALGEEARMKGASVLLAPTVNLQRTPFNGRNFECYSEDPWLTSEIALAYIRGVQSRGVAATIKHYVGNESEYQRMSISSDIPERALRELYLLPFERAVKEAGVLAVMTGYNCLDGVFAADHQRLVQQVLRGEWGFDGLVMTDWGASHDVCLSVLAGCDLEMPGPARVRGAALVAAVQEGRLPAAAVRACARHLLLLIERVGGFSNPLNVDVAAERADDLPAHRALIRQLGVEGAVLLKNDVSPLSASSPPAPLLPLALQPGKTVALIGRAAVTPQIMGGGSATVNAHYRSAPRDALAARLPGVTFTHHAGASIHRWVPVLQQPMELAFYNSVDFSGPVVYRQTAPNTEQLWIDSLDAAVNREAFSVRATLRFVADAAGPYQFSLVSAGRSRATIDGEPLVDAWAGWQRGGTYFTYGCDEVVAQRELHAGQVCHISIEFTSATDEPISIRALRFGAGRVLGEADIAAAVEAAKQADVAVVFAGLNAEWDNEGLDRTGMALPHRQDELIARVAAANPRTVVVLQTGSPVLLPWLAAVPAVLQAWYPGQECGNAIADVLLGHAEPGGRLAQTWPLRVADTVAFADALAYPGVQGHVRYGEGVFIGYRHHERQGGPVQFAFGHGLSYTRFAHSGLKLDRETLSPGDTLALETTVRNTGARSGQEVVQVYVHSVAASVERPPQELKAFAKLTLAPGEVQTVRLHLPMRAFAFYDEARAAWVAEAGRYEIRVGDSSAHSAHAAQRAAVVLAADWVSPAKAPATAPVKA
jgi:beta-glucosidase